MASATPTEPPRVASIAPPTRTATRWREQEAPASSAATMTIPSTTVIGLGLGFVAAALCIVSFTILLRVYQVRREVVRAQRAGERVTFRNMWNRYGGWWGNFFGHEESSLWSRRVQLTVRNLRIPDMHDVVLGKAEDHFDDSEKQPLSLDMKHGEHPQVSFAVLILMPVENGECDSTHSDEHQEEYDLPEVALGTTPYLSLPDNVHFVRDKEGTEKDFATVMHVEVSPAYQPPERRRGWLSSLLATPTMPGQWVADPRP